MTDFNQQIFESSFCKQHAALQLILSVRNRMQISPLLIWMRISDHIVWDVYKRCIFNFVNGVWAN